MTESEEQGAADDDCTRPPDHPLPAEQLDRYSPNQDFDSAQDIARYVSLEVGDEDVLHAERVKTEYVFGEAFEVWSVKTNKNAWWVLTNMTNLYSQAHFPSLDYTLSFHIGLMQRLKSRDSRPSAPEDSGFAEVFRRQAQVGDLWERDVEPEDFQSIGMLLRECLISLINVIRSKIDLLPGDEPPPASDFIRWSASITDQLCSGATNKELRQYIKSVSERTWQLANWLTHHRNANKSGAMVACEAVSNVVGNFANLLMRDRLDVTESCPVCASRSVRSHYDFSIEPDGDYYQTCGACGWSSHPDTGAAE